MRYHGLLLALATLTGVAGAQSLDCSFQEYKAADGLEATKSESGVTLTWQGEGGQELQASFGIRDGAPVVQKLAARQGTGSWAVLGKNLTPDFQVSTGKRRISQAQRTQLKALNKDTPEEESRRKWNTFWDAPLVIPGRGDTTDLPRTEAEITHASVSYQSSTCKVATEGNQLSVTFDGLKLGIFAGNLRFIAYKLMPMHPKPSADTSIPFVPKVRFSIAISSLSAEGLKPMPPIELRLGLHGS